MKELFETIIGTLIIVIIGNSASGIYRSVQKETLLKVKHGQISLVAFNNALINKKHDFYSDKTQ